MQRFTRMIGVGGLLTGCLALMFQTHGEISQTWDVTFLSRDGRPCETAAISLEIRDALGDTLAYHDVLLEVDEQGVNERFWDLEFPEPGDYQLVAVEQSCREGQMLGATIPLTVDGAKETRSIQVIAKGGGESWHLHYLGLTFQRPASEWLTLVQEENGLRVTNLTGRPLRPCQFVRGGAFQRFEVLAQDRAKWYRAGGFRLPDGSDQLPAEGSLVLEPSEVLHVESQPPGAQRVETYLRIHLEPDRSRFVYDADDPQSGTRPFPGICDVLLAPLEVQPPKGADVS